jgi:hypothetical protein
MQIRTNPLALGANIILPRCYVPNPLTTAELEQVLVDQGPERAVLVGPMGGVIGLFKWDPPCDLYPTSDDIGGPHEYAHAAE